MYVLTAWSLGTGLPTMNSVHQVAQSIAPESRVVYVDHDPVVLTHARDMLHGLPGTMITSHDLRDPEAVISDSRIRGMLDFGQPIAVLLIAVLRSRAAVNALFCGLPLLPPGKLTYAADWHPNADTAPASAPGGSSIWCGIARKP